jgi:hypothetical protein
MHIQLICPSDRKNSDQMDKSLFFQSTLNRYESLVKLNHLKNRNVMKKLTLIILLGLFLALPGLALAQQDQLNSSVYIQQAKESSTTSQANSTDSKDFMGIFSKIPASEWSIFKQLSGGAAAQKAKINIIGSNNITTLKQSGSYNAGFIKINGDDNSAQLKQNGNNLLSFINILGSSNIMHVNQHGNALQNYIDVEGTGIKFNVVQNAQGVMLQQFGGSAIPIQVKTTAASVPIIIQNKNP